MSELICTFILYIVKYEGGMTIFLSWVYQYFR